MWGELEAMAGARICELLGEEGRAESFSVSFEDMLLDFSKTTITQAARQALVVLAGERGVAERREAMFRGEKINETEGRAVLHVALRNLGGGPILVDGCDVMEDVRKTHARMERFARDVREGRIRGQGGPIEDVVNIGIGGSHLGPEMVTRALRPYHDGPRCHFVSNVDGADVSDTLSQLDPARTLVIVASKSFATVETMTNAQTARAWMAAHVEDPGAQFVAVSTALERTAAFGIAPERVFGFADWVGGRYSVWGPIGLPVMLAVGPEHFREFLDGGAAMDAHFREAPAAENMAVMLGLVGVWHAQVCGHPTRAVLPYDQRLMRLPAYLQQLEMESNGKSVTLQGAPLEGPGSPVVWGEPGTNGQHAFFQLLHQGKQVVPCEFMVAARGHEPELDHHHRLLLANCLAQAEALMRGRGIEETRARLAAAGYAGEELERQAAHRVFPGNRPSLVLLYDRLTPRRLGQIIALYEHRVFVEGVMLGINSFDQWGVELGKELAREIEPLVSGEADASGHDPSTRRLLAHARALRAGNQGASGI